MAIRYRGPGGWVDAQGYVRQGGSWVEFAEAEGPPPPPPPGTLLGVGSVSTSLVDFPQTGPITSGDFYVDPVNGDDGDAGDSVGSPFRTLAKALSVAEEGVTILVRAGTINLTSRIVRSVGWSTGITVSGYGTERPILSGAGLGSGSAGRILYLTGSSRREHWKGFEVVNAKERSVMIEGAHNKIEDFDVHHGLGEGIYIANFTGVEDGYNLVMDTDVWRIGTGIPGDSNVPDLIVVTASSGQRSRFNRIVRACGAWGPDDGLDFFRGESCEAVDCGMAYGGYYWNGVNSGGDGGNFKMGGGQANVGNNELRGSVGIGARGENIKPNNAQIAGRFYRNTGVGSGVGFTLDDENHQFEDNLSYDNVQNLLSGSPATERANSWNQGNPNPLFADPSAFDWSLLPGSPAIGAGFSGGNLGASDVALARMKAFLARVTPLV